MTLKTPSKIRNLQRKLYYKVNRRRRERVPWGARPSRKKTFASTPSMTRSTG